MSVFLPQFSEDHSYIKTISIFSLSSRENHTKWKQRGWLY